MAVRFTRSGDLVQASMGELSRNILKLRRDKGTVLRQVQEHAGRGIQILNFEEGPSLKRAELPLSTPGHAYYLFSRLDLSSKNPSIVYLLSTFTGSLKNHKKEFYLGPGGPTGKKSRPAEQLLEYGKGLPFKAKRGVEVLISLFM